MSVFANEQYRNQEITIVVSKMTFSVFPVQIATTNQTDLNLSFAYFFFNNTKTKRNFNFVSIVKEEKTHIFRISFRHKKQAAGCDFAKMPRKYYILHFLLAFELRFRVRRVSVQKILKCINQKFAHSLFGFGTQRQRVYVEKRIAFVKRTP